MSPRTASATTAAQRVASAPYSRRPATQPKSTRQQFSACGACRMRRVRCDLKDLPCSASSRSTCSNCTERGLRCVDEFAEVKAVKLLRRGRRLQQVEAIYGKTPNGPSSAPSDSRLFSSFPQLSPEFFSSPFWKWFSVQRPVLDPVEFPARFIAHTKGVHSLGHEGGLLAMALVLWAASFGLDETGSPTSSDNMSPPSPDKPSPTSSTSQGSLSPTDLRNCQRKRRKDKADVMLREILELIDFHGVLRRPTWDGVRVLLLLLPLLDEAHPLEKLAMSEAALSQTQALCIVSAVLPDQLPPGNSDDALVRAQIFWYAYIHESLTTALRGGRLVLQADDFDTFQKTIPSNGIADPNFMLAHSSSFRPLSSHGTVHPKSQRATTAQAFLPLFQLFSLPLQLSSVCRKIHQVLTGPKAMKRTEEHGLVDAHGMREIWDDLDRCWKEFDAMRRTHSDIFDTERYVSSWQIFIFECHNVIRETLKHHMSSTTDHSHQSLYPASSSRPDSHSASSPYLTPHSLYVTATRKCLGILSLILRILKFHLSDERQGDLFKWDAGLVGEGCYLAACLTASFEGETIEYPLESGDDEHVCSHLSCDVEEGVNLCLSALTEMRWSLSKGDEKEETIRLLWENRKNGRHPGRHLHNSSSRFSQHGPETFISALPTVVHSRPMTAGAINSLPQASGIDRPLLPPLHLLRSPRRAESAPSTGYTITGHGANGWPSYTPPGTSTSLATSVGTAVSVPASSDFTNLGHPMSTIAFKTNHQDSYYEPHQDLDQFSFNVPGSGFPEATISPGSQYFHCDPPSSAHSLHSTATPTFIDSTHFPPQNSSMISTASDSPPTCSRLADDCHNLYS